MFDNNSSTSFSPHTSLYHLSKNSSLFQELFTDNCVLNFLLETAPWGWVDRKLLEVSSFRDSRVSRPPPSPTHTHTPTWRVPEVGGARMWRAWPGDGEAVNYLTHRWRGYNGLAALTPLLMLGLQALGVSLFTLFLPSSCGRCSFFLSSFPLPLSSFCLLPLPPPRTAGDDRFLCQQTSPELILTGLLASTLLASCRNAVAFF